MPAMDIAPQASPGSVVFCANCGAQMSAAAVACPQCGTSVNTSGRGKGSPVPPEVRRWNWGAFLLNWIWGLGNGVYIALLALIPFAGLVMAFILGARGNEWAWQRRRWADVASFKRAQRIWGIVGACVVVGGIAFVVLVSLVGNTVLRSDPGVPKAVKTVTSAAGDYTLVVPESWREMELNEDASIEVGHAFDEEYVAVLLDDERDIGASLDRFSRFTRREVARSLTGSSVSAPRTVRVGRLRGIQVEIRGEIDGLKIVYLHTAVRTRDHFVQILAWTLPSRYADAQERLRFVIESFRAA